MAGVSISHITVYPAISKAKIDVRPATVRAKIDVRPATQGNVTVDTGE